MIFTNNNQPATYIIQLWKAIKQFLLFWSTLHNFYYSLASPPLKPTKNTLLPSILNSSYSVASCFPPQKSYIFLCSITLTTWKIKLAVSSKLHPYKNSSWSSLSQLQAKSPPLHMSQRYGNWQLFKLMRGMLPEKAKRMSYCF